MADLHDGPPRASLATSLPVTESARLSSSLLIPEKVEGGVASEYTIMAASPSRSATDDARVFRERQATPAARDQRRSRERERASPSLDDPELRAACIRTTRASLRCHCE